jgi:hypothetical protein
MSTYAIESIRDQIITHLHMPTDIQYIVIGYTVSIGDLLAYIPEVYPGADEWGMP